MEYNLHRKDGQTIDWIYENDDVIEGTIGKEIKRKDSTQGKSSELTESVCVRNRSSRAAAVCLVLLCVLLLTAVIVLCVMFTQERQQFISKIENLTNERVQLISKNENLTNERDQLISKNKNLTNERDQLRNDLRICAEWTRYQSRSYYISKEKKNWTESRRYCTERGADLIIINNTEEQDFVKNMSGAAAVWIGLTDSDVEGTWKWVDGSTLTSGFWASGQPGGQAENCVVTVPPVSARDWANSVGWHDETCTRALQWICEKRISQLILP